MTWPFGLRRVPWGAFDDDEWLAWTFGFIPILGSAPAFCNTTVFIHDFDGVFDSVFATPLYLYTTLSPDRVSNMSHCHP